jgi:hypothetical protein
MNWPYFAIALTGLVLGYYGGRIIEHWDKAEPHPLADKPQELQPSTNLIAGWLRETGISERVHGLDVALANLKRTNGLIFQQNETILQDHAETIEKLERLRADQIAIKHLAKALDRLPPSSSKGKNKKA